MSRYDSQPASRLQIPSQRRRSLFGPLVLALSGLSIIALLGLVLVRATVLRSARGHIATVAEAPASPVAIVFGAGVGAGGQPSPVLADRVQTAVDLYQAGKASKLLMTGDNRFQWYNEPGAKGQYAMERGVPAEDIVYHYAGRRTYDTCYRARHIFDVRQALLVTQEYHLPRAVYTCQQLGIDAVGVVADRRPYAGMRWFKLREMPALILSWWQTNVTRPLPVLGEPLPIEVALPPAES